MIEEFEITRFFSDREEKFLDRVTKEIPLTIYVNDSELVTLLASPNHLVELAVGYVFTSGFISEYTEILNVSENYKRYMISMKIDSENFDPEKGFRRIYTSGCGKGTFIYKIADLSNRKKNTSTLNIHRNQIFEIMKEFQTNSNGYKETGGVHSSALADNHNIVASREDIGRHNTIDKIIGHALINSVDLSDKIILCSGRISSEIILKVQKTPISIIASRGAPTDQAIQHARDCGMTLIGFVRGRRMNVYTGQQRVL